MLPLRDRNAHLSIEVSLSRVSVGVGLFEYAIRTLRGAVPAKHKIHGGPRNRRGDAFHLVG